MRHFTYNPFPVEDDRAMRTGSLRYQVKYGEKTVIQSNQRLRAGRHGEGEKSVPVIQMTPIKMEGFLCFYSRSKRPLKVVEPDDVLLINAHGSNEKLAIGCKVNQAGHNFYLTLTPLQLSEMLEEDGLGYTHRLIKMISCFGAASLKDQASDNFSKALAEQLGSRGYKQIIVGGYLHGTHLADENYGALSGDLGDLQVKDLTAEQRRVLSASRHELSVPGTETSGPSQKPAHGTRLYFNAEGESVSQERVDRMKRS